MAAYAYTVTKVQRRVARLNEVVGIAVLTGKINVTNYNSTTKPEVTEISKQFKDVMACVLGVSDSGYLFEYIDSTGAVKAYHFDYDAVADGAAIEAATDTDVGEAQFIAVGLV